MKNENDLNKAKSSFSDLSIKITTEGQRHLGAALGSESFKEAYVNEKVAKWHKELEKLSIIAKYQPQAAYSAFINGYRHKFTYYVRTIPNIAHLLKPTEDIITSDLLPQILGFEGSLLDREIFALPTRLGGLGIPVLTTEADFKYNASKTLSAPLAALVVTQNMFALPDEEILINTTKKLKRERIARVDAISTSLNQHLAPEMTRTISNASAKGPSNWLNVLPLAEEGYVLNKEEFRDDMAMRYSKHILGLPSKCACGSNFDPVHPLHCKKGGFIHSRHDQLRSLEVKMLSEVCQEIEIEPQLQPLTGENMSLQSANTEDSADLM